MKVKIDSILIEGFLSIGSPVEFKIEKGLTSIVGENRTDNFSTSNGSGKSSLIEAIVWCLSGTTSRGIKNDAVINMFYPEGCSVAINIMIDNAGYTVIRTRGGNKGNTLRIINPAGEEVSGNTASKSQSILDDLLPFNYEDLTTLIILSQGMPGKLSSQKPSGRKSILESIASYSDSITSLSQKISSEYTEVESTSMKLTKDIVTCTGTLDSLSRSIELNKDLMLKEVERISKFNDTIDIINEENSKIRQEVKEATTELLRLESDLESKNTLKDSAVSEVSVIKDTLTDLNYQKVSITSNIASNEATLREINKENSELNEGKCFTCGADLTDSSVLHELREANAKKIEVAEKSILDLTEKLRTLVPSIETNKLSLDHHTHDLDVLNTELSNMKYSLGQLIKISAQVEKSVPEFTDNTKFYDAEIIRLTSEMEAIRTSIASYEEVRVGIIKKAEILKKIQYDVSRGAFRTFVLQRAVSTFNSILYHISLAIMKDKQVYLDFDGNNVEIMYGNKVYEQMSGGERNRIDIALELTKRKYKSMVTGLEFNVLVMDEVIDGLDSYGISAIFDAVETSGACESFLVISHRKDIELDYNRVIKVIKEDNLSRIEVI